MDTRIDPDRALRPENARPAPRIRVNRTYRRHHTGWKGRTTPKRPCGAPGDAYWPEPPAGE